jgi:hypothetical protein
MRIVFAASTVATAGLIAAGVLGVAGAETTTSTTTVSGAPISPPRTVSVQGVAREPIEQSATAAQATTVYRQGMADAIADGLAKAQFLAGKAGATLGAIQSIVEGGGYIGCSGEGEYQGEQPDFGSTPTFGSAVGVNAPALKRPAAAPRPPAKRPRRHRRRAAKKASTTGTVHCTLSTQLSLAYALT